MDIYVIVLRIVHILGGVFWVGAAIVFFYFLEPTAHALGPQGQPFIKHVVDKRRLPIYIVAANLLTVLSGVLLYWRDSGGFRLDWITSPPGIGFTIGGIAAIVATVVGVGFIRPTVEKFGALGDRLATAGRPPTDEEMGEVHALQGALRRFGGIDLAFLTVAVLTMATARYWSW